MITSPPLTINPFLDIGRLAEAFAKNQRLQIRDFLAPQSAHALRAELESSREWRHVISGGSKVFEISRAALDVMPVDQRNQIDAAAVAGAASGFQFRYDIIRMPDDSAKRQAIKTRLAEFATLMASSSVLELIGVITNRPALAFADAQATLYRAGDFLTRHDDDVAGKHRELAYVLGLTDGWQPEWGGLLLFNEHDGGLAEAIVPRFNALSLFSVPQPHSVGYVAPFAHRPRLSITGWIRSQKPTR